MTEIRAIVLFPTEDQFNEKSNELMLDACYWTIPTYPKNKEDLIGRKIYFYDKANNYITLRATITGFGIHDNKKTVIFQINHNDDDESFELYLDDEGFKKRKQTRGWCYKWWE